MYLIVFYIFIFLLFPICAFGAGEGRPLKEGTFDLPKLFKNPPPGYGEVPFYWWMGDKLDKAHLLSHLEELEGKGIQSLQVNYAHSDRGGRSWGLTYKSDPPLMSDKHYYLYTKVYAPRDGDFEIISGAIKPAQVFVNGSLLPDSANSAHLKKGANELVLRCDSHGATHFLFRDAKAPEGRFDFAEAQRPLSMSWNGMKNNLPFDASCDFSKPIRFSFESAPALEELRFAVWGEGVSVKIGGCLADISLIEKREDGARSYRARAREFSRGASKVEIEIAKPREGFGGAAALSGYIRQSCGEGEIELASWDKFEGMRTYSGGAIYSKDFDLEKDKVGKRIVLNLVEVGGLARVRANGKDAGVRFYPPWTFELGDLLKEGKNRLEIEVYNTAANHCLTMPTRYRGDTKSGLLGTPRLEFYNISAAAN